MTQIKRKKEIRSAALTVEQAENSPENEMHLTGYAAVFNRPTVLCKLGGVEYKEVILKSAFDNTNMSDCCLRYNHSENVPVLARVRGGSLKLNVDDTGLKFDASLFNTISAKDVYTLVKK